MGISDEIDDATVAIHETTILYNKATIWRRRFFRNRRLNIKISFGKPSCDNQFSL